MRIQLATASSVSTPCAGVECTLNQEFDQQVQSVGYRLALAAYDAYPDLIKRVSEFQFEVAEKSGAGSTSNAAGKIVIYRGVQKLGFDEAGLAFIVAREMGHVIGQHHDENSGTRILLSIAAGVLFPALNLFNAAQVAQATQVTSAATLSTTVASTATSYLGSKAVLAGLKPDQLSEADAIALDLLEREGWHLHDIASVLDKREVVQSGGSWAEDFRISLANLQKLDAQDQSMKLSMPAEAIQLRDMPQAAPDTPVEDQAAAVPESPVSELPIPELPIMVQAISPPTDEQQVPASSKPVEMPVKEETAPAQTAALAENSGNAPLKLQATPRLRADSRLSKKHVAGKKPSKPKRLKMAARKKPPAVKPANAGTVARNKAAKPVPSRLRVASVKPRQPLQRD